MDTSVAIIVVCGLLNLVPWLLLAYFRPDRSILHQLEESDSALAGIFQHVMGRIDEVSAPLNSANENPLMHIVQMFLEQRMNSTNLIDRDDSGRFNATQTQDKAQTRLDEDFFERTR